ncbi:MAG: hypothetical protein AVDCRST_MAG89-3451 [uncultured Gemmatimonadetes bacterium]|uniref:Uncharacterized protein n=1 Tax=uncultured Gemmatimonadota bacterium TaxID=203437 RepID=A0A6J4MC64_9BACT|nr:MAG: hypothetical protein AVDCRST_MAG89-3451 [uncultured Gemmatimonadota bacterium]
MGREEGGALRGKEGAAEVLPPRLVRSSAPPRDSFCPFGGR